MAVGNSLEKRLITSLESLRRKLQSEEKKNSLLRGKCWVYLPC